MQKNNTRSGDFEDFKVNLKMKLSALWISLMFCYLYGDYFEYFLPGHISDMIDGKVILDNPVKLLAASILMVIPSLMVFMSLVLKPKVNRLTNIILGIFYTLVMLLTLSSSMSLWRAFYIFLGVVEIAITVVIVWLAWKWPRQ